MQEKNTNVPNEKKPGDGQQWPETGKQGGQTDIGKKGGDTKKVDDELGKTGDVSKP